MPARHAPGDSHSGHRIGRTAAAIVAAATVPTLAQEAQFTYHFQAPAVLAPGQTATIAVYCEFSPDVGHLVATSGHGIVPVAGLGWGGFEIAGTGGAWASLSLLPPVNWLIQFGVTSAGTASGPHITGVNYNVCSPLMACGVLTVNPAPIWTASFTMPAHDVSINLIPEGEHAVYTWGYHNVAAFGAASPAHATILVDLCDPDCNEDGALTIADFGCFQTRFVAADPYADCNEDGVLTVADFGCFQTRFFVGCP